MLCAGLTVFAPLKRYGAAPGQTVGVLGLGGLGHFAVLFARAMDCRRIVVFSHSPDKRADALEMGADDFVLTSDEGWADEHSDSLDLLVCTVDKAEAIKMAELASMMRMHGRIVSMLLSLHANGR